MNRAKVIAPFSAIASIRIRRKLLIRRRSPVFGHESCSSIAGYMAKIDAFFNLMFEQKASDLHLSSGNPPILRINGELTRVDVPPLEDDQLKIMLYEIAPEYKIKT